MKFAALFSDHMVIQQRVPVPVWGWASPGDRITVRLMPAAGSGNREQKKTAIAGADGEWMVRFAPLKASPVPAQMTAHSNADGTITVRDILVGEVWLCSGQSNMQMTVKECANPDKEKAEANWPAIRMFSVPQLVNIQPPADVAASWRVCTPNTAGDFSAAGYFFGRRLHQTLKVPIGLVNSSWGGTRVEAWTSRDALIKDKLCKAEVKGFETILGAMDEEKHKAQIAAYQSNPDLWLQEHVVKDPGNRAFGRGWAKPGFKDSGWPVMDLPMQWQRGGVPGNGIVWFRREIDIPASWTGRDLTLSIGCCDKHDVTYFNNVKVGATSWETKNPWTVARSYQVPAGLVRPGRNVVAVRVYSYRNAGGMVGPVDQMKIVPVDGRNATPIPLSGNWKYRIEHDFGVIVGAAAQPEPIPNQNSPYALFEHMIRPLVPYAIRGAIWYQGESNTDKPLLYRKRFPMMIRDWRRAWGNRTMPFLFVQLPNFLPPIQPKGPSAWALLREAQLMTLRDPATGMAVAIDLGDPSDIHPKNKQDIGLRLGILAESTVYKTQTVPTGPICVSHSVHGKVMHLKFKNCGGGLIPHGDGLLRGFEVAGKDRRFVSAEAYANGDTVTIRASTIKKPVAVRYAWEDNPVCNLYNSAGLPASPFRTDNWPE